MELKRDLARRNQRRMKLEIKSLRVRLNGKDVLKDITLSLDSGLTVIIGENSSGKTTLLKTMAGLVKPSAGEVLVDGKSIHQLHARERARLIGYCWQNPYHGFFEENVKREIEFILKNTGVTGRKDYVKILGVEKLFNKNPFKLSGGEARRVSIASVVVADQPIVLMDEPFNDMDLDGYRSLRKLVEILKKEKKIIVIALNNAMMMESLSPDLIVLLRGGNVVKVGKPGEIGEKEFEENNIVTRRALIESSESNY
ncbi:MAG: energy-coupling factor ABC transporter ATP-binding protein [Fervidicoccaceae archaeon]